MVKCFVQKFILHSPSSLGNLLVGSRVPLIAETSTPITENCTKIQPATGADFTTTGRMCICFNDQTHPYPPDRRIPLARIIVISRDTGPSAGLSFSRIRTFNSSRTINIYHRTTFHQSDPSTSGGASFGYDTHEKLVTAGQKLTSGRYEHPWNSSLQRVCTNSHSNPQWSIR